MRRRLPVLLRWSAAGGAAALASAVGAVIQREKEIEEANRSKQQVLPINNKLIEAVDGIEEGYVIVQRYHIPTPTDAQCQQSQPPQPINIEADDKPQKPNKQEERSEDINNNNNNKKDTTTRDVSSTVSSPSPVPAEVYRPVRFLQFDWRNPNMRRIIDGTTKRTTRQQHQQQQQQQQYIDELNAARRMEQEEADRLQTETKKRKKRKKKTPNPTPDAPIHPSDPTPVDPTPVVVVTAPTVPDALPPLSPTGVLPPIAESNLSSPPPRRRIDTTDDDNDSNKFHPPPPFTLSPASSTSSHHQHGWILIDSPFFGNRYTKLRSPTSFTHRTESSSSSSSSTPHLPPRSPWSGLTRTFLQPITQFLDLRDFVVTSRVCVGWFLEADQVACRDESVQLISLHEVVGWLNLIQHRRRMRLRTMAQARIARHITQLDLTDGTIGGVHCTPPYEVSTNELEMIRDGMSWLTSLTCNIKLDSDSLDDDLDEDDRLLRWRFPPTLTTLHLIFVLPRDFRSRMTLIWKRLIDCLAGITCIPSLAHLTISIEKFTKQNYTGLQIDRHVKDGTGQNGSNKNGRVEDEDDDDDDGDADDGASYPLWEAIESILPLSDRLISLEISSPWSSSSYSLDSNVDEWCSERFDMLRRFSSLTKLHLDSRSWSTGELNHLFDEPFMMPLKYLSLRSTVISDGLDACLMRLTQLQRFQPGRLALLDPAFLSAYQHLESCRLMCDDIVDVDYLIDAITQCKRLKSLNLGHSEMTTAQLATLLSSLSQLVSVGMFGMERVTSLEFFQQLQHLSTQLTKLEIDNCINLSTSEAVHIHALHGLKELQLTNAFATELDDSIAATMTPDSTTFLKEVWPNLTAFLHTENRQHNINIPQFAMIE